MRRISKKTLECELNELRTRKVSGAVVHRFNDILAATICELALCEDNEPIPEDRELRIYKNIKKLSIMTMRR
jgi:hypothetical protein